MSELRRRAVRESAACGGAALALYATTAARSPQFGDGLEFAAAAAVGGVPHPTGYPLLTMLLAPFMDGTGAYLRGAQLCGLFGAIAVFCAVWLARMLCGWRPEDPANRWVVPALGAFLAASAGLWSASTIIEVYALNAALLLGVMAILLPGDEVSDRRLAGGTFLFGLALTNHLTAGCLLPLVLWRWVESLRRGAARPGPWLAVLAGAAGLLPWLYVPLRAATGPPINWGNARGLDGFLWLVGGGDYRATQFLQSAPGMPFDARGYGEFFWRRVADLLTSTGTQFLGGPVRAGGPEQVGGFAVGVGMVTLAVLGGRLYWGRSKAAVAVLAVAVVLQLALVFTYNIADIRDYFLGVWIVLLPFWILGTESVLLRLGDALGYWTDAKRARRMQVALALAVAAVFLANFGAGSRAGMPAGREWMANAAAYLESSDRPVLLLTHADYDTYGAWYLKYVEGRATNTDVVAANFMRQPWYESMVGEGVDVRPEPGEFSQFTLEDHVEMLARAVIEPNKATHRIVTTSADPIAVNALGERYDLRPVAQLLTEERLEALVEGGAPALPPHLLIEVR